jgi:hypothetical protein
MPKRSHPLAKFFGEGVVTGIATWASWRFIVKPLGRSAGRLAHRFRRVLGPLWIAIGLEIGAVLWHWLARPWWPLALVLVVAGATIGAAGPRLSKALSGTTLALVPDSIRAGRKGVLDRPAERVYATALLVWVGGWLALRVGAGASAVTTWGWLIGWLGFGGMWWWHRRVRVAGRADRYARRWRRLADPTKTSNPKFKPLHGSKVVAATGRRRGLCTLVIRLAHGMTAEDVTPILPNIASWYRLRAGAITLAEDEDNASRVELRFLPGDPFKSWLAHPAPVAGSYSLASLESRLALAVNAAGAILHWLITHALIVGQTGSGKSVLLESILKWVTGATDAIAVGGDMASGATLGVWRRVLALPLADDYDSVVVLLGRIMALIETRERRLGLMKETDDEAPDSYVDDPSVPWVFVIIDEWPDWVAEANLRSQKQFDENRSGLAHLALVGKIGKRARKTKVVLILAAQNGSKADMGTKELQGQLRSQFGLKLQAHANRVLWREMVRQGWTSLGLKVGQFMLADDEHGTPETWKGWGKMSVRTRRDHVAAAEQVHVALHPEDAAALFDTMDPEIAAGAIIDAPVEPQVTDPILDRLHVEAATAKELHEATGISRATVFRRLKAYADRGLVSSDKGVWSLVREETHA